MPSSKKKPRKPKYEDMIRESLSSHVGGIDFDSIALYLKSHFPVPKNFKQFLKTALKKSIEKGSLVQTGELYRINLEPAVVSGMVVEGADNEEESFSQKISARVKRRLFFPN
jgi:hypothetical protein